MAIRREYIGSGKKFIRYSPEEMADARQTDMLDFLSRKEGFTFIRVGSVYQCNEHDSLICLLYTSPSPRDTERSRMPSSA